MKKLLLVFAFALFYSNVQSQDLIDIITQEVCSCAEAKKETLQEADAQKIKMELGICMISSVLKHKDEVTTEYGKVMEDEDAMERFATDIGVKMAVTCPDIFLVMAEMTEDDVYEAPVEEDEYYTAEGRIVEIKQEQFLTVMVKDNSGRTHTMLLLTFFEGSNLLTEGTLKKNDKVSVDYFEQEFYDVKAKDFRYYKVIQGIKKI